MKPFYSFPNVKGSRFLFQKNSVYNNIYDHGTELCNPLHLYSKIFLIEATEFSVGIVFDILTFLYVSFLVCVFIFILNFGWFYFCCIFFVSVTQLLNFSENVYCFLLKKNEAELNPVHASPLVRSLLYGVYSPCFFPESGSGK